MATEGTAVSGGTERDERVANASVLVVSDHPNPGKIARHWEPLADIAGETTMVCINDADDVDGISFVTVPDFGYRLLGIPLLLLVGLREAIGNEYDVVASISLVPYGTFGLVIGALTDTPTHLGIIGADIDQHARAWYGAVPRWLIRRFDSVSVPGTTHTDRLVDAGVDPERIFILTNAIDVAEYSPPEEDAVRAYDFVWIGRFSREKAPTRFVEALADLRARGHVFSAVMIGDGDRTEATRELVERYELTDSVTFTGWVDDPATYYHQSRVFVLTSRRDAMPLTLVEAMATGVAPVVPRIGSIPDVAEHEWNALVVEKRTASALADAMERLLEDCELRRELTARVTEVRSTHSYEAARNDWRRILATLLATG
ncbi:glycosyltransferase family 4 protein [Halorientalis marina]|jgi:glycosyltransferase involved in cell wall biosynthesis|uniref:glycosyltransferase family 4 protein n=1 Tax=Halorientalis marina TaxID=2931976 RepID=UPI001FF5A7E5|nr:glycosyltransferase family 4 protein [Halorientalis marina]